MRKCLPIVITGFEYIITIADDLIHIGCESGTLSEWRAWDGENPPRLWAARESLFAIAEAHQAHAQQGPLKDD
jgi:hypothetical protein